MRILRKTLGIIAFLGAMIGVLYLNHLLFNPTPRQVVLPRPSILEDLHKTLPGTFPDYKSQPGVLPDFHAQRQTLEEYQRRQSSPAATPGTQPVVTTSEKAEPKDVHP